MPGPIIGYGVAVTLDGKTWTHGHAVADSLMAVEAAVREEYEENGGTEDVYKDNPRAQIRITEIRGVRAI